MAKTKNDDPSKYHSPQEQTVLAVDEELHKYRFNLWAHGTPSDEPESFFDTGVRVSSDGEHSLANYAVPLDKSNITEINDWPHKRELGKKPNVVLLAYPFNAEGSGLTHRIIQHQILDHDRGVLPPSFIVGFYNSTTGEVIRNPDFALTNESQSEVLADIKRKQDAEMATFLGEEALGPAGTSSPSTSEPLRRTGSFDIW